MNKSTVFLLFAMALSLFSCHNSGSDSQRPAASQPDSAALRLAVMPGMDCMPFFVAQDYGLFAYEGLKVALVSFNAQMDVDTALIGGSVDGGVTDRFRADEMQQRGTRLSVWAPAQTEWTLVAAKKSRLTKVSQFSAKLVAMTRHSATAHLSEEAFKQLDKNPPYFIQINDVIVRTNMLINGELDAVWLQEPQVSAVLARGGNIVNDGVEREPFGQFVFRQQSRFTADKGNRLRRAYNSACDSINKNGIRAYAPQLQKYCHADTAAINRLSAFKFKKL